jgi:hypothetical protein
VIGILILGGGGDLEMFLLEVLKFLLLEVLILQRRPVDLL